MTTIDVDGVELYYQEEGNGPPLLLIHGSGVDADVWRMAFDELSKTFRTITYDRRGFSRSTADPIADWHRHGEDAAALLEALGAAPAAVAGWSGGSQVAVDLAVHHPELVRSLVLVEPVTFGRKHLTPGIVKTVVGAKLRARRDERKAAEGFYRWVTGFRDGGSTWDIMPAEFKEPMLANARVMLTEQDAKDSYLKGRVEEIDCPVTIVVGGRTQTWFDKTARGLAELIPQAELVVIERSNHAFGMEAPGELARVVREGSLKETAAGVATS